MKKKIMWMFMFLVLAAASYGAWHGQDVKTVEAHGFKVYGLMFDRSVSVPWFKFRRHVFYRTTQYQELCFVDKGVYDQVERGDWKARGTDQWGLKYYKIKSNAEVRLSALTKKSDCYRI